MSIAKWSGLVFAAFLAPPLGHAQLTRGDFERALDLQEHYRALIDHLPDAREWIEGANTFVYRETTHAVGGGGRRDG